MDFNLKTYKLFKIKHFFKTVNVFFFFHGVSVNNKNWIKIEQALINYQLDYYRVYNTLTNTVLKKSIFKNLTPLINGPLILIKNKNLKKFSLAFNTLRIINSSMCFLCLKLNNKIYTKRQINSLNKVTYIENISVFHKLLGNFTKTPYFRLKSK